MDECIGQIDACGVCNGPGAVYDCGCNDLPAGDCDCDGNGPAAGYDCNGDCLDDADGDGICDAFEVAGCTDEAACNYDASATDDDGSCDYCSCAEEDETANDYTLTVEVHAEDIIEGQTTYRFYQNMLNPDDFLSSVYGGEIAPLAIETTTGFYNSQFGSSVASGVNPAFYSFFPELQGDSWVTIGIESESVGDEVVISTIESLTQPWVNAFAFGQSISGENVYINDQAGGTWYVLNGTPNGLPNSDGRVLLMQITTAGDVSGTLNMQIFQNGVGSNSLYNTYAFDGPGTYTIDGAVATTTCGCTDPEASNYDADADYDDGSCEFDEAGCTDTFACNYDAAATTDDGSCEYTTCLGCTDSEACNYDPEAVYNDGSCEYASCQTYGCTNANACNYNPEATANDGSCEYASCAGCTDPAAANYDPEASLDDGSCEFPGCLNPLACNYDPEANTSDGSCDFTSCAGCLNPAACNFDPTYTISDPSACVFAEDEYDCDGNCLQDTDGDGVCDPFEIAGCTDASANNYDADATDDDGSCAFDVDGCLNPLACNYNPLRPFPMVLANSIRVSDVWIQMRATTTLRPPLKENAFTQMSVAFVEVMALPKELATALEISRKPVTIATAIAWSTRTAMGCAMPSKWQAAQQTMPPATLMHPPPMMTVPVTSVEQDAAAPHRTR